MKSIFRRLLCVLAAFLLLSPAFPVSAGSNTPLSIRVLLSRLSLSDRADLTVAGRYLARSAGGTELLLSDGTQAAILLRENRLILFSGGLSADMGTTLFLTRLQSEEAVPGIRFNLQPGFYPGDLTLSVENGRIIPVLTLPLEAYVRGVVPYEMGDSFPEEALKAQAVCARTYALSRISQKRNWDVTDTTSDQVFRGWDAGNPKSDKAVEETAGLVLTCSGKLITAWYSASNGGQTELPANIWPGEAPPCFAMKEDPWDSENPDATIRICTLARDGSGLSPAFVRQLQQAVTADPLLQERFPDGDSFRLKQLVALELMTPRYSAPSRLMTQLRVTFELPAQQAADNRDATEEADLTISELLSDALVTVTLDLFPETVISLGLSVAGADNEIITLREDETSFTLTAGRFGHGVGMSQRGAQQMAGAGEKSFQEILAFYYPGAEIKKATDLPEALPTPPPPLIPDPGPAPTATPRPTLMPLPDIMPEGARIATVENIAEDSSLNLRALPSAGAEILMRLFCHQPLLVLEQSDVPGWVYVRTDSMEGYVMESYLQYEE